LIQEMEAILETAKQTDCNLVLKTDVNVKSAFEVMQPITNFEDVCDKFGMQELPDLS